jgi:RHS repeat-associated protein
MRSIFAPALIDNCAGTNWSYNNFTDDPHDGESNTEHTWFRQLSTTQGRWLSPDPAGLAAVDPTNPQSWNRYAYVSNDPLSFVDPLGLFMQCGAGSHTAPDPSNPRASICVDGAGVNASTTHQIPHPVTIWLYDDTHPDTGPPILRRQVAANNAVATNPKEVGTPKTSAQCSIYLEGGTASGKALNFLCRQFPDDPWSQRMRGCLQAVYDPNSGYLPIPVPIGPTPGSGIDLNKIIPGTGAHVGCAINASGW